MISYIDGHRSCGIKVGDYVRIHRRAASQEAGWLAQWNPYMDKYVGRIGQVVGDVTDSGFRVEFDKINWLFPYFVLTRVDTEVSKEDKEVLADDPRVVRSKIELLEKFGKTEFTLDEVISIVRNIVYKPKQEEQP